MLHNFSFAKRDVMLQQTNINASYGVLSVLHQGCHKICVRRTIRRMVAVISAAASQTEQDGNLSGFLAV